MVGRRRSASSESRAIRARAEAMDRAIDLVEPVRPLITARRLVVVYDGGAIPTSAGRVYLTHPAELDGAEFEAGGATVVSDSSVTIPVVVLGAAAVAGDVLVAYAVGGRWVSEKGGTSSTGYPCGSCTIPATDLTLSWTNPIFGDGSVTLTYYSSGGTRWASACTQELLFTLLCNQGSVELRVTYFLSGSCPSGQSQYASNLRSNPYRLTLTSLTCGSSFLMALTVTYAGNPNLSSFGYTSFTVSR